MAACTVSRDACDAIIERWRTADDVSGQRRSADGGRPPDHMHCQHLLHHRIPEAAPLVAVRTSGLTAETLVRSLQVAEFAIAARAQAARPSRTMHPRTRPRACARARPVPDQAAKSGIISAGRLTNRSYSRTWFWFAPRGPCASWAAGGQPTSERRVRVAVAWRVRGALPCTAAGSARTRAPQTGTYACPPVAWCLCEGREVVSAGPAGGGRGQGSRGRGPCPPRQ